MTDVGNSTVNIRIEGMEQLAARVRNLPPSIRKKQMEKVFRAGSKQMLQMIKSKAPVAEKTIKRYSGGKVAAIYQPGNLRDSIAYLPTKDNLKMYTRITPRVGKNRKNDGYYAHFLEGGTKKMAAKSWFLDAAQTAHAETVQNISAQMDKIFNKYFQKHGYK